MHLFYWRILNIALRTVALLLKEAIAVVGCWSSLNESSTRKNIFLEENVFFWPIAEDLSNPKIEAFLFSKHNEINFAVHNRLLCKMIYAQKIRSDTEFVNTIHNVR